jgi:hypothetical protein
VTHNSGATYGTRQEEFHLTGIKKIIKYPNYVPSSRYNDIALLEIDEFSNDIPVIPACLWPTFDFSFDDLAAAGWGVNAQGDCF